jgi:class 3 adenylate cyclase/HAMP domain-containing protein
VTIRRRLASAFLIVLMLFAVNEGIQIWSARLRAQTMETVGRALKRQLLMASLQSRIADLHKQISLMGQIEADAGPAPGGREALDGEIGRAGADIQTLIQLSEPADQAAVQDLGKTFGELAEAWQRFYDYLGVEPAWALAFQVKAEPLGRRVVIEQLPALQRQQAQRADDAERQFAEVTRQTQRVSLGIFGGSMLLAIGIAWQLSQYLKTRLADLKLGASMIGLMNLDHRITIDSKDELASVATSFNEMAANLAQARHEVTAANAELVARHAEVEEQRHRSESLLLNILPAQVARELATRGEVAPRYFEDVTILFTDFVGFTLATERLAADEVVSVLHDYFKVFDDIAERYGLEKLKTIGDSYFCAGGLPVRTPSHPIDATLAAFEMIREVEQRVLPDGNRWQVRIGLHTGPVVAGVVGTRKFAFDVWGDTVNRASRIETAAAPNRINVSSAVQRRIKDFFATESRGLVSTKEGTQLEMFSVVGVLPSLLDEAGACPPARFVARYETYFDRPLSAFPEFLIPSPSST